MVIFPIVDNHLYICIFYIVILWVVVIEKYIIIKHFQIRKPIPHWFNINTY